MKYFEINNVRYPLLQIRPEEMDDILKDKANRKLIAYPQYWDERGRIWPKPEEGLEIKDTYVDP